MCFVALLLGFACFFWLTITASTVQIVHKEKYHYLFFTSCIHESGYEESIMLLYFKQ